MGKTLKIIIAGEVDAGKSSLIGRFLYETDSLPVGLIDQIGRECADFGQPFEFAYLLDSLNEERQGQLTIETTHAFYKKRGINLSFIDVPGHQELVNNMISGSSVGDSAVLVVDVSQPVSKGLQRHVNILKFLGIQEITVAVNKMDLAGFKSSAWKAAKKQISLCLKKTNIRCRFFLPISAGRGDNFIKRSKSMPWYKGPLLSDALLNKKPMVKKGTHFCFPVQDAYQLDNDRIYAGTVIAGSIKNGQTVKSTLCDGNFKVKYIKIFKIRKAKAGVNESIGLSLSGPKELNRGDILYKNDPPQASSVIKADIFCLKPVRVASRLILKCLNQEVPVKISKITRIMDASTCGYRTGNGIIRCGELARVIIRAEKPIAYKRFRDSESLGRFALDDGRNICAAGTIV